MLLLGARLFAGDLAKPNLVIVLSDDHSVLDSSVYGATDVRTPNMQRLAAAGLTFDRAFVASPSCAPSRAALLTGLMPARNGAEANQSRPRTELRKLPAYLQDLGYEVVAFGKVAHYNQARDYGFDHFAYDGTDHFRNDAHDAMVVVAAVKWLRDRTSSKPLCLFVGINSPHVPWPSDPGGYDAVQLELPPTHIDTPRTRHARIRYYSAVSRMDSALGDVFDAVNEILGKNTLILHTSDHGGHWPFAKWNCYDAGIRVPFIAVWPGRIRPGTRTDAMVSWIDILPTLVDIGGGSPPAGIDGQSFAPVIRGETTAHRDRIFTTHSSDGKMNVYPMRSVRTADWKYILNVRPDFLFTSHVDLEDRPERPDYFKSWREAAQAGTPAATVLRRYHERPREELYNLAADPFERHNLASNPRHAARLATMRAEVEGWMIEHGDTGRVIGEPRLRSAAGTNVDASTGQRSR